MHPRGLVWTLLLTLMGCSSASDDTTTSQASETISVGSTSAADPPTTSGAPPDGTTSTDGGTGGGTTSSSGAIDPTTSGAATSDETTGGETTSGETTESPVDDPRLATLITYAPRVWMHPDEQYFPSTVELAFADMTRFLGPDGNWWVRSTEPLASASDTLPFFAGDLAGAPVYAYYAAKAGGVVDLVYFFWYPYNRGKEVVNTIWGNHVGDWEHITVRLTLDQNDQLTPQQVYLSAHSFGGAYDWSQIQRHEDTHPIVYSARGSHGVWSEPGDHVYMTIGEEVFGVCVTIVCADLTDETAAGIAWDTWTNVAGFDYFAQEGLGGQSWPTWMHDAFTDPGPDPTAVPGAAPIYRWGNTEDCTTLGVDISDLIGVCRLEHGPTGPASKNVWGPELQ